MLRLLTVLTIAASLVGLVPEAMAQKGKLRTIHQERSLYRNILVTEDDERLCMRFTVTELNGLNQTCRFFDDHDRLVFPYAKMVLSSLMVKDNPESILILGLGGGTLVHTYSTLFPQAKIKIVEIDQAVVDVAEEYFDYKDTDLISTEVVDGRVFIKREGLRGAKYDLIILDAFTGEYIPEHLMTTEFLQEVKRLLPDDGMLIANTFSTSRLYAAESNTYREVFGEFFNVRMSGTGNRIIIASMQPLPDRATLEARAPQLQPRVARFGMDMTEFPRLLETKADWNLRERILTDEYSPVNQLNN